LDVSLGKISHWISGMICSLSILLQAIDIILGVVHQDIVDSTLTTETIITSWTKAHNLFTGNRK
jgi:hypothetical protein